MFYLTQKIYGLKLESQVYVPRMITLYSKSVMCYSLVFNPLKPENRKTGSYNKIVIYLKIY